MKIQIRSGVFETNSSSTHAVAIGRKISRKGYPESMHFGLFDESDFYSYVNSVEDRADFLYTEILLSYYYDIEEIEKWKQKIIDYLAEEGITDVDFERYYTTKNEEGDVEADTYSMDLHIDHDSVSRDFVTEILADKQTFFEYLFGDNSCIILGRDGSNFEYVKKEKEKGSLIISDYFDSWY